MERDRRMLARLGKPITLPPPPRTLLSRTHRTQSWDGCTGSLARCKQISAFLLPHRTCLHLIYIYKYICFIKQQSENPGQREWLTWRQSITTAICFLFCLRCCVSTISDGFDSASPEDTLSGFISSTVAGSICSRDSQTSLFYQK